jgi:hypothetical protein
MSPEFPELAQIAAKCLYNMKEALAGYLSLGSTRLEKL